MCLSKDDRGAPEHHMWRVLVFELTGPDILLEESSGLEYVPVGPQRTYDKNKETAQIKP